MDEDKQNSQEQESSDRETPQMEVRDILAKADRAINEIDAAEPELSRMKASTASLMASVAQQQAEFLRSLQPTQTLQAFSSFARAPERAMRNKLKILTSAPMRQLSAMTANIVNMAPLTNALETLEPTRQLQRTIVKIAKEVSTFRTSMQIAETMARSFLRSITIRIPDSDRLACECAYEALLHEDEDAIKRFTYDCLGLSTKYWWAVGHALLEGRWRGADNPTAYLRVVAQRIFASSQTIGKPLLKGRTRLSLHQPISDNVNGDGSNQRYIDVIPSSIDGRATLENDALLNELRAECRRVGLGNDAIRLAIARIRLGITRAEAPSFLGWTPRKVQRHWRQLGRAKEKLPEWVQAWIFRYGRR